MFYEEVFRKLAEKKVRYAVAGGVALVLHGVVRLTVDLDLIVEMSSENLLRFIGVMNELGYKPRVPVSVEDFTDPIKRKQWIEEKGMKVFTFYNPKRQINQVDVFINEPIKFDIIENGIVWFNTRDIAIPVVSRIHLKMLKQAAGRPQDIADIEAIEQLEGGEDG